MMQRFGVHRMKVDGTPAKEPSLPPLEELQRDPKTILAWIDYATLDSDLTWYLREALHRKSLPPYDHPHV